MGLRDLWILKKMRDLAVDYTPDSTVLCGLIVIGVFVGFGVLLIYLRGLLQILVVAWLFIELCHLIGGGHSNP